MEVDDVARLLTDTGACTVLIDGRSGSGKSTLAQRLSALWRSSVVVRLDDVYPGWDGLNWAKDHIREALIEPRATGGRSRWRRWDWTTDAPAGWHDVDPRQRLIVEGVGALTAANRALADMGIWVETPDVERKRRALERDGDMYRPHWDQWAAQEDAFIARHRPQAVADWVMTETPGGPVWTPGPARV